MKTLTVREAEGQFASTPVGPVNAKVQKVRASLTPAGRIGNIRDLGEICYVFSKAFAAKKLRQQLEFMAPSLLC